MNWLDTGKSLLKGTADAAYGAASQIGRRESGLRAATGRVIGGAGQAISATGELTARTAATVALRLHHHADHANALPIKGASRAAAWAASALAVPGRALRSSGVLTGKAAPVIGAATGGVVAGSICLASELIDSVALGQSQITAMREELRQHGQRIAEDSSALQRRIGSATRRRRRRQLLDLLVIGGMPLGAVRQHSGQLPARLERAFALAWPDLAMDGSFQQALDHVPVEQLPSLACAVKGKLLELELVEHFNAGNLPVGMQARMAVSATHAGQDIRILDQYGLVVDRLQALASQTVEQVQQVLDRHPGLDVTSLHDLQAHLLALGLAQNVRDNAISDQSLQNAIQQAADGMTLAFSARDLVPSPEGMAMISLSLLLDSQMDWSDKPGEPASGSSARLHAGYTADRSLMVSTLAWWTGLMAGVSAHWLAGKGRARRQQYQTLLQAVGHLRAHPTNPPGLQPFVV